MSISRGLSTMPKRNNNKPLTNKTVEDFIRKPDAKVLCDVGENTGLRVEIRTNTATYILRYSAFDKKLKQIKLGPATGRQAISLLDARNLVAEYKKMRREGVDPVTHIKEKKAKLAANIAQAKQDKYTVARLMQHYIDECLCNRNLKGRTEAERLIKKDILAKFGRLTAHNLTQSQVHDHMHDIIQTRNTPVQAGYMVRELKAAYEHAFSAGRLPETIRNPCTGVKVKGSKKRTRYLSVDEIAILVKWFPQSKLSDNSKNVLILTLLTGARSGELTALKWIQVDLKRGAIILSNTKTDVPRNIQLSSQAIFILKALKDKAINEWVFPSNRPPRKAINQHSINLQVNYNREFSGVDDWSAHDLRRTCRTHLAKMSCPSDVAEAILGHTKGGIEGHYNLHRYEPEQKVWLQKWADFIDEAVQESLANKEEKEA